MTSVPAVVVSGSGLEERPARRHPPGPAPSHLGQPRSISASESGERAVHRLEPWVQAFAVAVVDVLAGRRAPASLRRWLTPQAFRALELQTLRTRSVGPSLPAYPMTAHLFPTVSGECEFSVTVWDHSRARAVAGRISPQRQRWVVTEVETR